MMPVTMRRICVIGFGPLPFDPGTEHTAAGRRTWQLAAGLAEAGLPVEALVAESSASEPAARRAPDAVRSGVCISRRTRGELEDSASFRAELDRIEPLALVGATAYASYLACRSGSRAPLWVDFFGDPFAEGQALATVRGDEQPIHDAWWMAAWCLRRGDRFSAVSTAQRFALLGELGAFGRLTAANTGERLCEVVPEACIELPGAAANGVEAREFTVLFSGGFNTWIDGETLVGALRLAMSEAPTLRFVAAGGEIPGFLAEPWQEFCDRIRALPESVRERVELHGRLRSESLDELESRCSCGIVPEKRLVERELGGQNRSLSWMARGLPVVTTVMSEMGREIVDCGAGVAYEPGSARSLADALLRLSRERAWARETGRRARAWVAEHRSIVATTRPLVAWARSPAAAPDRIAGDGRTFTRRQAEALRDQLHLEESLETAAPS